MGSTVTEEVIAPDGTQVPVRRGRLLTMRVSEIIAASPGALDTLIRAGFEPLANPVMRRTLAPTVSLSQALRIRNLPDPAAEALILALLELGADRPGGENAAA